MASFLEDLLAKVRAQGGSPQMDSMGPVNRSGPATPPPIPMPANQAMGSGPYMDIAKALSGVPGIGGGMMYPTPGIGQVAQQGLARGMNGIDPKILAQLYMAKSHPLIAALYGLR